MLQEDSELKNVKDKAKSISKALTALGYFIGVIVFIYGVIKTDQESSALPLIISVFAAILSAMTFVAMATVIELLSKIYENTKESS